MASLPKPGDLVYLDYRRGTQQLATQRPIKLLQVSQLQIAHLFINLKQQSEALRTMQWNIERGYKLEQIVQELKQIDADVIALQEVDIGCERSDSIDTGTLHSNELTDGALLFASCHCRLLVDQLHLHS